MSADAIYQRFTLAVGFLAVMMLTAVLRDTGSLTETQALIVGTAALGLGVWQILTVLMKTDLVQNAMGVVFR